MSAAEPMEARRRSRRVAALFAACAGCVAAPPGSLGGGGAGGPPGGGALHPASGPFAEAGWAGTGSADTGPASDTGSGQPHDLDPIVVIGAGPAGMAVAMDLEAPILLEASDRVGGRAPGAPNLIAFVGTPEQRAAGVEDSVEAAAADWPTLTGAEATEATLRWLEDSAGVRDRLVELGMSFDRLSADPVLGRSRSHATAVGLDAVLAGGLHAGVDLRLLTPATGLRFADGAVTGVETEAGTVAARAVVIASGGFANRVDLVARFAPWEAGTWGVGTDTGAQGDAVDWADRFGLGLAATDAIGAAADAIGLPGADGLATRRATGGVPPWIWVDESGARFVDESASWSLTLAAAAQARAPVWCLSTEAHLTAAVDAAELARVLAGATCAEDWIALGAAIGVDADGIARTLDGIAHPEGSEDPTGRDPRSFPAFDGRPCAFPPGLLASKTFGGLAVDADGRVLDAAGAVVPGLWAVGEAAGMGVPGMGGAWGFDGSLSAVVWSGWRTAAALAAEGPP
jgi:fumarate reductase flavoprotein subunit